MTGRHRTKWRIRLKDEGIFSLAGLWEWWRDPESGEGVETKGRRNRRIRIALG